MGENAKIMRIVNLISVERMFAMEISLIMQPVSFTMIVLV
jgi:hypothetical protein